MPHVQNKVSGACRREAQALLLSSPPPVRAKTLRAKGPFYTLI